MNAHKQPVDVGRVHSCDWVIVKEGPLFEGLILIPDSIIDSDLINSQRTQYDDNQMAYWYVVGRDACVDKLRQRVEDKAMDLVSAFVD